MSRIAWYTWHSLLIGAALSLMLLLSACGGSSTGSGATTTTGYSVPASSNNGSSASGSSNTGGQSQQKSPSTKSASIITQYLIKTLKVTMQMKNPTQAADDIQNWINATDPRSTSAGINYDSVGDNLFNISLSFSVQSTLYPQIQRYLRDYSSQHKGQLVGFSESVQDVTNDYVDTQSRLTNLRGAQQRLLTLLSKAQALGDIITIQDKLTDVEGQIESIEAHLKALNDQVTFYTVSIAIQPLMVTTEPQPQNTPWNVGQVFHDAFAASLGFAQGIATFLIWLLAYSFYIIPAALIAWGIWRWRTHPRPTASPPPSVSI